MGWFLGGLLVSLLLVLLAGGLLLSLALGQMSEKDRWFHGCL